jgi:hypothetical protein
MAASTPAQHVFTPGDKSYFDSVSPTDSFATFFEDDGDTGYFYAMERKGAEFHIVDALQIYVVANVTDRHKPSELAIVWSSDGTKAALLINDNSHAVFDFAAKRGYCRTGFGTASADWPDARHDWSDADV